MTVIQQDDTVTLIYTGKLDNGEVFTVAGEDQPMIVRMGKQELPPAVEEALLGMKKGERKTIRVPPDQGYGPRQKELIQTIANPELVQKIKPQRGMVLSLKVEREGEEHHVPATVISVTDAEMEVDYNHPLAGHHLTYAFTVLEIERGTSTENSAKA